jgi:hypothetical protein
MTPHTLLASTPADHPRDLFLVAIRQSRPRKRDDGTAQLGAVLTLSDPYKE